MTKNSRLLSTFLVVFVSVLALADSEFIRADIVVFNSNSPSQNAATRDAWLDSIGITVGMYFVDFETGFIDQQNVSGIADLFPGQLIVRDTGQGTPEVLIFEADDDPGDPVGPIGGSNPVGQFSLTQDEEPYLELDFSARPVDYIGLLDIDHNGTDVIVTFEDDTQFFMSMDEAPFSGDTAEFIGFYRNDRPRIMKIEFDSSGDQRWGIDNIEYGVIPEPGTGAAIVFVVFISVLRRHDSRNSWQRYDRKRS